MPSRDPLARDLRQGRVGMVEGTLGKRTMTTNSSRGSSLTTHYFDIAGRSFEVPRSEARAAPEAGIVRVYFRPQSRKVMNLERLPDRPLSPGALASPTEAIRGWVAGPISMTFAPDGTLRTAMPGGHEQDGRWSVGEAGEAWIAGDTLALAAPLLGRAQATKGLFDGGRPVEGLLLLAGVLGALACLAGRRPPGDATAGPSLLDRAGVGPFSGGLLLVAAGGVTALGLAPWEVFGLCVLAARIMVGMRVLVPPLPATLRRALVTPFVRAAGNLFWSLVAAVTGGVASSDRLGAAALSSPAAVAPALGCLAAFTAVYCAMLVYAPRQVAEREGSPLAWGGGTDCSPSASSSGAAGSRFSVREDGGLTRAPLAPRLAVRPWGQVAARGVAARHPRPRRRPGIAAVLSSERAAGGRVSPGRE